MKVDLVLYLGFRDMTTLYSRGQPYDNLTTSSIGSAGVDPDPSGVKTDTRSPSSTGDLLDRER